VLTIAATYVAFLLFAQFGFLSQVRREVVEAGRVRFVMGAMGIAGLAASLGTAWLLGRLPGRRGPRLIRIGLAAVAAVAMVSVVSHGLPALTAVAVGIGGSIGLLTVAVAASLPEIVPRRSMGLAAGLGTGVAYLASNVPALFEAAPAVQALFPAALALVALALSPRGIEGEEVAEPEPAADGSPGLARLLVVFLVLIWLDSAAFAVVQATPALKDQTWGSAAQKLVQGSVHLLAAAGAGALLDAGVFLAIPLAAWGLFAVAFPLLQAGGGAVAGPLYAVGISLYSTALVVAPSRGSSLSPRWRAGLLFGVAGWIGSALGVGMAQDLGRIPAWFLGVTGVVLAMAMLRPRLRFRAPGVALGAFGVVAGLGGIQQQPAGTAEGRGRLVYIEEGCIHCHSQYVRPGTRDVSWWGPARPVDRGEQPPLIGTRRQGPDLMQVGNRRGAAWQEAHLRDPRALNPGSRMPSYAHLFAGGGQRGRDLVAYLMSLGAATAVERWTLTGRETVPPLAGSPERGRVLFGEYCAVCHGAQGSGDGPLAAKLNDPKANLRKGRFASLRPGAEPEALGLARIVRHGLPPTAMPGHEWLTDQQVSDLVAFVQTFAKEPS
jgi:cytochrome c oxidase cbb3-type subunit 2